MEDEYVPMSNTAIVCTLEKPVSELRAGDVVVIGNRAHYLTVPVRHVSGYVTWEYEVFGPDGAVTGRGWSEFDSSRPVRVVAVTLDGALLVP